MPSVNDTLADEFRRHGIDLLRFDAGLRRKAITELRRVERRIVAKLAEGGELTGYQEARLRALFGFVQNTIRTGYKTTADLVDKELAGLADVEAAFTAGAVRELAHVDMADVGFTQEQLRAIVDDTLIEGAPSREWWARQAGDTQKRFEDTVRSGRLFGETTDQISRRVEEQLGVSKRNANALVRSSVQAIANSARVEALKANDDVVKGIAQVSTLDGRTTPICIAYAGKAWDLDFAPIDHDLPWNGGPPRHWNCRSTTVPVLKSFRELGIDRDEFRPGTRASMDGQVPRDKTFDEFLREKPDSFVDDMLGKGKADLWREGRITLTDLVDQSGNEVSLAELRALADRRGPPPAPPTPPPPPAPPPRPVAPAKPREPWDGVPDAPNLPDWQERSFVSAAGVEAADIILAAVRRLPQPTKITNEADPGKAFPAADAYYSPAIGRINMAPGYSFERDLDIYSRKGERATVTVEHSLATWRHEYGHHLDRELGKRAGVPFFDAYRSSQEDVLTELRKDGRALTKTGSSVYNPETHSRILEREDAVRRLDAELDKATENIPANDERAWREARELWLDERLRKHGLDIVSVRRFLDEEGMGGPGALDVIRFIVAFDEHDGGFLIDKAMRASAAYWKASSGSLADLFGALTNERIGWGHGAAYYKSRNGEKTRGTEGFANVVSLATSRNATVYRVIMAKFAPRFSAKILALLKEAGDGTA